MPAPRRLRRSEPGRADPPVGTTHGAATIEAPLDPAHSDDAGRRGFPDGSSNLAAPKSTGTYKDEAEGAASAHWTPLKNEKSPFTVGGGSGGERE